MIVYILLLFGVFLFSTWFYAGLNGFSSAKYHPDWEENHREMVRKKSRGVLIFSILLLILTGFGGYYLKSSMFLLWFVLVFILTYFLMNKRR